MKCVVDVEWRAMVNEIHIAGHTFDTMKTADVLCPCESYSQNVLVCGINQLALHSFLIAFEKWHVAGYSIEFVYQAGFQMQKNYYPDRSPITSIPLRHENSLSYMCSAR